VGNVDEATGMLAAWLTTEKHTRLALFSVIYAQGSSPMHWLSKATCASTHLERNILAQNVERLFVWHLSWSPIKRSIAIKGLML